MARGHESQIVVNKSVATTPCGRGRDAVRRAEATGQIGRSVGGVGDFLSVAKTP